MKKILTAEEMKRDDAATIAAGTHAVELMERAARAALDVLMAEFDTTKVIFCCGPGNNGGDGFAMARLFAAQGGNAVVCYIGKMTSDKKPDTAAMSAACAAQAARLPKSVPLLDAPTFSGVTAVVDALFGIGLSRALEGKFLDTVEKINTSHLPVLSVDIPSGVHTDTGRVMGSAVRATRTVAIATLKYGHILYPGAMLVGKLSVADIGIAIGEAKGHMLTPDDLTFLPPRPARAHKGSFGRVLVVGGSPAMSGAGLLAAKAAYRAGAGLVELLSAAENRIVYQTSLPEAIVSCYNDGNAEEQLTTSLANADAVAIGMGLSTSDTAKKLVALALAKTTVPLIVDADALNLISGDNALRALLYLRTASTVVTPHPAEMARLSGTPVPLVLSDLPTCARSYSTDSGAITVLKDARTVIADRETLFFNTHGNSGMATGGSGDVLAGIIASFAAQGATAQTAAALGVLAHAMAGDVAAKKCGNHGLMASDIIEGLCAVLP